MKKNEQAEVPAEEEEYCCDLDRLGDLDIHELDNVINFADGLANSLAEKTRERLNSLSQSSQNMNKSKEKMVASFRKKKEVLVKTIHSAPFTRTYDKIVFIYSVLQILLTAFILGRHGHDLYYKFHTLMLVGKVAIKFYVYNSKGWHYYMTDFCYFVNTLLIMFLHFFPKNQALFITCFLYSNGVLCVSVWAFRN